MSGSVKIEGLSEMDKQLKKLSGAVEGKIVRAGLSAASRVVRDAAKDLAPTDSGALKKSIKVSSRLNRRAGWINTKITAGNKEAYYAHMIEFGTGSYYSGTGTKSKRSPYKIKAGKKGFVGFGGVYRKSFTHPGIRPKPFMRPAFDRNIDKALKAFSDRVRKRIDKEFKAK